MQRFLGQIQKLSETTHGWSRCNDFWVRYSICMYYIHLHLLLSREWLGFLPRYRLFLGHSSKFYLQLVLIRTGSFVNFVGRVCPKFNNNQVVHTHTHKGGKLYQTWQSLNCFSNFSSAILYLFSAQVVLDLMMLKFSLLPEVSFQIFACYNIENFAPLA